MGLGEFFAFLETMPDLARIERLEALNVRIIAGQRGVGDEDYERIVDEMSRPCRRSVARVSKAERAAFEARVDKLNAAWRSR